MAETELLDMLASETDRRCGTIIKGVEQLAASGSSDPERLEELRVEAHGLKGAAMVVGQDRLAKLAEEIESSFASQGAAGAIDTRLAADLVAATTALHEGARAAADGSSEPPTVADALNTLAR